MRRCIAKLYDSKTKTHSEIECTFIAFMQDYEEFENGGAMYPCALVELDNGSVDICLATNVVFLKSPQPQAAGEGCSIPCEECVGCGNPSGVTQNGVRYLCAKCHGTGKRHQ